MGEIGDEMEEGMVGGGGGGGDVEMGLGEGGGGKGWWGGDNGI